MKIKKIGLVVLVISMLAMVVGAVGAQDNQPGGNGPRDQRRPRAALAVGQDLVQIVATELGLEPTDVLLLLREGKSLATIITENNGDLEAITAKLIAAETERINAAVADEKLQQARADELLANLETFITNALNREPRLGEGNGQPRPGGRGPAGQVIEGIVQLAATQTGLEVQTIVEDLRNGATLSSILTENNVDVDTFIDAAVAQATTRINEQVAEGHITQARADQMLENLREQLVARINNTATPRQPKNAINT